MRRVFIFTTGTTKNIYKQIQKNPKVEAAFIRNADDPVNFETLRVTGSVEILEDEELKKAAASRKTMVAGKHRESRS